MYGNGAGTGKVHTLPAYRLIRLVRRRALTVSLGEAVGLTARLSVVLLTVKATIRPTRTSFLASALFATQANNCY